jgi:hypothetical protein
MDPVTGAAVIMGLQVVGKPATELATSLLERLLGPAVDAAGNALAHPIIEWQKRRVAKAAQLLDDAANMLSGAGIEPQQVPGRILLPILQHASLEADDTLHSKWAALLANAATPTKADKMLPGYTDTLRQLTPLQAQIIDWLYGRRQALSDQPGDDHHPRVLRAKVEERFALSKADYALLITDLDRMKLIRPTDALHREVYREIQLTAFGLRFIEACQPPDPIGTVHRETPAM